VLLVTNLPINPRMKPSAYQAETPAN